MRDFSDQFTNPSPERSLVWRAIDCALCWRARLAMAPQETQTDFNHPHDQERRAAVAAAWCLATSQTGAPPAATPNSKLARRKGHTPDLGSGSIDQEVTSMWSAVLVVP